MKTIDMRIQGPFVCPWCRKRQDALSGMTTPKNGDVSICANCTQASLIMLREGVLSLRSPITEDEVTMLERARANFFRHGWERPTNVDPLHPFGRCTCAGEGTCDWCALFEEPA